MPPPAPASAPPDADVVAAPRYLRFVTALVLGAAVAAVPLALGACGDETAPADARADARAPDATVPIDSGVVDGPLPPPDLPRAALA